MSKDIAYIGLDISQIKEIKKIINPYNFYKDFFFDGYLFFNIEKQFDIIIIDLLDNYIFNYYINPRAKKDCVVKILENKSSDILRDNTYEKNNEDIFIKLTENKLIFNSQIIDNLRKKTNSDIYKSTLKANKILNEELLNLKIETHLMNSFLDFRRDSKINILCSSVAETIALIGVLEEILFYSKFVRVFIDTRFHLIFYKKYKKYIDSFKLKIDFYDAVPYSICEKSKQPKKNDFLFFYDAEIFTFFRPSFDNFKKFDMNLFTPQQEIYNKNLFIDIKMGYKKVVGISLATMSERGAYINLTVDGVLYDFISEKQDTLFVIIQYKLGDLYEKYYLNNDKNKRLKNLKIIMSGIDIDNDFEATNGLIKLFDYCITIDNSSLYQFGISGANTYFFLKDFYQEDNCPTQSILQKSDKNNYLLLFKNVKRYYNKDYEKGLKLMLEDIKKQYYS